MKVLSFNTGYFLGYEGTHLDYLKHPVKSINGSKTEETNLQEFLDILDEEDPDFVLAQEVDGGSTRTSTGNQHRYLAKRMSEYSSQFNRKYRGIIYPRTPILRHMGNSVFFKKGSYEKHSLSIGRKNLVQEIKLPEFSIFSLHLATFGQWVRRRQLRQIKKIAEERENYVLTGDLNLHKGKKEIDYLEKILGSKVHSPGKTFPAAKPSQKLDLVAKSGNLEIKNLRELGNHFSDHRPISFEINPKF